MASVPSSSSPPTPTATATATPTRILFGVNESSIRGYPHPSISSRAAFDWTLRKLIRSNAAGFFFLFLHVQVPDEDGFDDMDSIYASPDDFKNKNEKQKIKGLHLLQYFVERSHQVGIKCEAWLKMGDPKVVICEEAKRVQPDLLVVGSRGLGPVQRFLSENNKTCYYGVRDKEHYSEVFVGAVSDFCVKHADCPVITIKRKAEDSPNDPVYD